MMNIDVYFRHEDVNSADLQNRHIVVIDVLRATSVMVTALQNGAKSVQAVAEIEDAFALQKANPDILLAGERHAIKIPGFHFGNSPLEMTKQNIAQKDLVVCTSNGTKAIAAASQASSIRLAAFINMKAVANELSALNKDFTIICSGTNGQFSLDDGLAAGVLILKIKNQRKVLLSDSALAMTIAVNPKIPLHKLLKDCYHLNLLQKRGFQNDIDYCLTLDMINIVPQWKDGKFTI